jgi:prephenate dehydrogenase
MTSDDHFNTVAIAGVGLIGGSLGLSLRQAGVCSHVLGVGRNPGRLEHARQLGIIDSISTDLAEASERSNLIILCTPVAQIIADLPVALKHAGADAVITDAGSVKAQIVAASNGDPRFIGCHPMAGSHQTGADAARADLFRGAAWVVTPTEATSERAFRAGEALGRAVGSIVAALSPSDHDQAVALISHLPHVMASSLVAVCDAEKPRTPKLPLLSAGSFRDATRVADSSADLWRDVCMTNRDAIIGAIDRYVDQLILVKSLIETSDSEALREFFAAAAKAKRAWLHTSS